MPCRPPPRPQVSGRVRIVNDCTFEVSGFTYDGQGSDVYWWGAFSTAYNDIRSEGFRIVPEQVTRSYHGETVGGMSACTCRWLLPACVGRRCGLPPLGLGVWGGPQRWRRVRQHLPLTPPAPGRRSPAVCLAAFPGRRSTSRCATASRSTISRSSACGARTGQSTLGMPHGAETKLTVKPVLANDRSGPRLGATAEEEDHKCATQNKKRDCHCKAAHGT